jgi:hypothetical protein
MLGMIATGMAAFTLEACGPGGPLAFWGKDEPVGVDRTVRPDGWAEATHGDGGLPDHDTVFPRERVNRLDITIAPEDWQVMLDDMTALYGEQGAGEPQMPGPPSGAGGRTPAGAGSPPGEDWQGDQGPRPALPERAEPPQVRGRRPGAGVGGPMASRNPTWAPATVAFGDGVWTRVGIRLKGNSSLMSTWRSGSLKLPFKLDFDQFEDDYPETDDQRFYGLKQLSFSSNWSDPSLLREKVAADIFRAAGVPAPNTGFYAVHLDYGAEPVYLGLYTAVEVVEDTVIQTQFADASGNVYKPSGTGATFAEGTFSEASFDKETNGDEADWSDVLALFEALHSKRRTSDPEAWRRGLEAIFDVDAFLSWLAVNTVIQNWDTYGNMAHNYYLYNDPGTGRLTWIPWDNNMALSDRFAQRSTLPLDLSTVGADWPLIRYPIDDATYRERYAAHVAAAIAGPFEPAQMADTYRSFHALVAPYVPEGGEAVGAAPFSVMPTFEEELEELIAHAESRRAAATAFLTAER